MGGAAGEWGLSPSLQTASTTTPVNTDGHVEQMKLEAVSYISAISFIKGVTGGVPNSTERRGGGGGGDSAARPASR